MQCAGNARETHARRDGRRDTSQGSVRPVHLLAVSSYKVIVFVRICMIFSLLMLFVAIIPKGV